VPPGPARSTAAWSSARTWWRTGERSAATATERASFGSFLFDVPVESSLTRAELGLDIDDMLACRQQLLGQHVPQPARAPSTAQVRSGQAAARSSNCAAWLEQARTLSSPSGTSAG
jgi:hypothetical protein